MKKINFKLRLVAFVISIILSVFNITGIVTSSSFSKGSGTTVGLVTLLFDLLHLNTQANASIIYLIASIAIITVDIVLIVLIYRTYKDKMPNYAALGILALLFMNLIPALLLFFSGTETKEQFEYRKKYMDPNSPYQGVPNQSSTSSFQNTTQQPYQPQQQNFQQPQNPQQTSWRNDVVVTNAPSQNTQETQTARSAQEQSYSQDFRNQNAFKSEKSQTSADKQKEKNRQAKLERKAEKESRKPEKDKAKGKAKQPTKSTSTPYSGNKTISQQGFEEFDNFDNYNFGDKDDKRMGAFK